MSQNFISLVVAVLGTKISPYLFFWQSSPEQASAAYERIRIDTRVGMALRNVVGLAIIVTAGVTLHVAAKTDVDSAQTAVDPQHQITGATEW